MLPVAAHKEAFIFPVVQVDVGHFLFGLYVVGLFWRDVSEHAQCQLRVAPHQRQVGVGDSDP